jgi:hypothetical protein
LRNNLRHWIFGDDIHLVGGRGHPTGGGESGLGAALKKKTTKLKTPTHLLKRKPKAHTYLNL